MWAAWPLCYFLQLFKLSMVEKTLRIKFREVLSQAAVSGVLPGGCTCIQQCGCAPSGEHSSELGVGEELLLFSFSYGEAEAG